MSTTDASPVWTADLWTGEALTLDGHEFLIEQVGPQRWEVECLTCRWYRACAAANLPYEWQEQSCKDSLRAILAHTRPDEAVPEEVLDTAAFMAALSGHLSTAVDALAEQTR